MRLVDEGQSDIVVKVWGVNVELDGEREPAGGERTDADAGRHVGPAEISTLPDELECRMEAGCVAAANSCSGLVAPPGPPISLGLLYWPVIQSQGAGRESC